MKNKKVILVVAAVCVVLVLLGLTIKDKNLDLNSKEVGDLYKYLGEVDINHCGGLITYSDKEITQKSLSEEERLCMAYYQVEDNNKKQESMKSTGKNNKDIKICKVGEKTTIVADEEDDKKCTYEMIKEKDLKESYQKIYGKEIDSNKPFYITSKEICRKEGETYYCGTAETFQYSILPETTIYRLMNKAIKKLNGDINLYDYFLKVSDKTCYAKNNNEETKECSDALKKQKEIDQKFISKYGSIYKHTFKKDANGNYYWYKSEIKWLIVK